MLKEDFFKEYPIQKGTNISSLCVVSQSYRPLRLAQYSDSGLKYWIMQNARVYQPASRKRFRNYILANLKDFLTGEKATYHIGRVDFFPNRIIIVLVCEELERLEIDDATARERLAALRNAHGLPKDETEDEDEDEAAELWYDASHEDDNEYATRISCLFPELREHLAEIRKEVEVCLTGDVLLHLIEEVSPRITDEYTAHLQGIGFNLKITRGNGFSRYTLLDGDFNWKGVDNDVMVGIIHKDYFEVHSAMSL